MMAFDERTRDETPEFLFSEGQVRVIDGVFGFHFSQHVNKRLGAHFHMRAPSESV
jgi:hypothetical protein